MDGVEHVHFEEDENLRESEQNDQRQDVIGSENQHKTGESGNPETEKSSCEVAEKFHCNVNEGQCYSPRSHPALGRSSSLVAIAQTNVTEQAVQTSPDDSSVQSQSNLHHSFNETLKAALNTYSSSTALRASNNPPAPLPPPFLSHQEECTIRTALAFVIIQARNKGKGYNNCSFMSSISNVGWSNSESMINNPFVNPTEVTGRVGVAVRGKGRMGSEKASSLFGGLLKMPNCRPYLISQLTNSPKNKRIMLDRELKLICDILRLAVSSVLPLYRGALEKKETKVDSNAHGAEDDDTEGSKKVMFYSRCNRGAQIEEECSIMRNDDGNDPGVRRPCAVYDYEAAVSSSSVLNTDFKASLNSNVMGRHYAALDGLCQYAITRLCRLINDQALRDCKKTRTKRMEVIKSSRDSSEKKTDEEYVKDLGGSKINNNYEKNQVHKKIRKVKEQTNIVRDAIVKLIYDDLIGFAFLHGSQDLPLNASANDFN